METSIKTKDEVIYNYFKTLNASIPSFQRSYEWGGNQVDEFIQDLFAEIAADDDRQKSYFFGQIVTAEADDGTYQIIDGQQRLTTSTILFAAIRNYAGVFKNSAEAQKIIGVISENLIGDGGEYNPYKLIQNGSIAQFFRENIQKYNPSFGAKEFSVIKGKKSKGMGKVNNIIRAYNQILDAIIHRVEKRAPEDQPLELKLIFDTFIYHFFVVEIHSRNRTDAFQIFQTINARGLDLTASDLLKSDFFGNSGSNIDTVQSLWNSTQKNLGDLDMSEFIRYSWNSSRKFTLKRNLYKSVSANTPHDEILGFVRYLNELSPAYAEMMGSDDISYIEKTESGKRLLNSFAELGTLNFKIYAPLYLAMVHKKFKIPTMEHVMHQVKITLIRNKIESKGSNWLEKLLSTMAIGISNGDNNEIEQSQLVIEDLKKRQASDDAIRNDLTEPIEDARLAKSILRTIENTRYSERGLLPSDNSKVHLEHIMPVNPHSLAEWSNISQEDHDYYLWKLGNLTLLLGTFNESIGNSRFDDKKLQYVNSDVQLTRKLNKYSNWSIKEIDKRTKELINEFVSL